MNYISGWLNGFGEGIEATFDRLRKAEFQSGYNTAKLEEALKSLQKTIEELLESQPKKKIK